MRARLTTMITLLRLTVYRSKAKILRKVGARAALQHLVIVAITPLFKR